MKNNKFLLFLSIIVLVNFFVWFKSLSLEFYNDDFQILGYWQENFVQKPLSIFFQKDVSNHYFRPIPNFLGTLLLLNFGYNPLPFRLISLVLYLTLIIVFYLFLNKMFNSDSLAFAFALFFSLLPSHDLFLVWFASLGDTLALLFILVSFFFLLFCHIRFALSIALLFFLLSILSKESTIFAPLFALSLSFIFKEKKNILRRFSYFSLLILVLLFVYRFFLLEINIFSSQNIANLSWIKILINFFLYPFVFAIPTFAYSLENTLGILLNAILSLLICSYLIIYFSEKEQKDTRNILFGLLWYFWFVLPALPLFMRWYSFLPSVGLIIVLVELARKIKPKFLFSTFIPFSLIFFVVDYYSISGWKKSNVVACNILEATKKIETNEIRGVLLWFFPQYYNNYPILRSGIQQAVNFNRKVQFEQVLLPVSIVLNPKSSIQLSKSNKNEFAFTIYNAKVFIHNRNEKFEKKVYIQNDYYQLTIIQENNKTKYFVDIIFLKPKPEYSNYYFNGKSFQSFY